MKNPIAVCVDHNPLSSLDELVGMIAEAGLNGVEWFEYGPEDPWSNAATAQHLRTLVRRLELTAQYHAPYEGPCDLALEGEALRAPCSVARTVSSALERAERLGARLVTFHPGTCPPGADRTEALESVMEGILLIVPELERRETRIALENHTPAFKGSPLGQRPEEFAWLMDRIASRWVGRTLDIGHAHIDGRLDAFLAGPFDRVFNVHLHDNDGRADQHLPLAAGTVPWAGALGQIAAAAYRGPLTFEFLAQGLDYADSIALVRNVK